MLAKSLELELKIYGLLTVRDSTTEELATTLHVTPRALKENVRKLNDFAENLLHIKDLVAVDFKGNYAVNPEHLADKDRLFGYLKEAAYETTPKFQVVLALITNPSIQKNTIAKRLYISTTRVTSIVNQLNTELAPWEIEIVSDNGSLSFGGRELCIRMYSYIILADAFQSLRDSKDIIDYDSPFHYDMKRYTLPKDNAERFTKSALVHLQNVMDIRLSSGHTLDEVEPEKYERLRHFFGVLRDNYDVSRHINPFLKGLTAEKKEQEQLYFNFFVRILFSDGVPENDRRHLMTKLYLSDDLYGKIAMKCVLYLQKVGFLETGTDESFDHLTYFLVMYFVYFDILRTSSFILDDTRFVLPDYYQDEEPSQAKAQLLGYMKAFLKEQNFDFPYDEMMVKSVLNLVVSAIHTREAVSLRIFIQTNFEMAKRTLIVDFLTMHFWPDALEFVDEYSTADLIVTDNIGEFPETIPVLFMKSMTSREQWTILADEVQDLLIKKTLYR